MEPTKHSSKILQLSTLIIIQLQAWGYLHGSLYILQGLINALTCVGADVIIQRLSNRPQLT